MTINPSARLNEAIYDEGGSHDDTDLIVASATPPLTLKGYRAVAQRMLELDKDLIEGLKAIGFKHDMGEDEAGHQMKYFRRGGGYYWIARQKGACFEEGRFSGLTSCSRNSPTRWSVTRRCATGFSPG